MGRQKIAAAVLGALVLVLSLYFLLLPCFHASSLPFRTSSSDLQQTTSQMTLRTSTAGTGSGYALECVSNPLVGSGECTFNIFVKGVTVEDPPLSLSCSASGSSTVCTWTGQSIPKGSTIQIETTYPGCGWTIVVG